MKHSFVSPCWWLHQIHVTKLNPLWNLWEEILCLHMKFPLTLIPTEMSGFCPWKQQKMCLFHNSNFTAPHWKKKLGCFAMRTVLPIGEKRLIIFIAFMNYKNLYKSADAYCIRHSSKFTDLHFLPGWALKDTFTCFYNYSRFNCFTWKYLFTRWEPVALSLQWFKLKTTPHWRKICRIEMP